MKPLKVNTTNGVIMALIYDYVWENTSEVAALPIGAHKRTYKGLNFVMLVTENEIIVNFLLC